MAEEEKEGILAVELECGHEVPFSKKSIELNGTPRRWWCNKCRNSLAVVNLLRK